MTEQFYFSTADILVFSASLLISAGIGLFYAYKDRNNKSVDKYYYGSRKMSPVSVGISISVSFISAVTVLGYPAETYLYGTVSLWLCFQLVIPNIIAYFYYIPMVHTLKLKTIYEYLELRFSVSTRKLAAAIEIMNTLLYMGSTMYLPALALNAVTPINLNTSIILTSFICTLYTAFGGIKAVVWTDVVQALIMFIGSTAALIVPTVYVGGPSQVYEALKRGERLNFFEFDPDPRIRSTFWTIMVGTSIAQTTLSCCNQSIVQRYSSCKNVSDARKAAIISLFPKILLSLMCLCTGCAAFAFYENCDPLKSKKITKADQIVPFMVTELFQGVPGCAGIFVAAAYSGTMSSVSSGINSATSLVLQDFILAVKPDTKEKTKMRISFWVALLIGAISTGLAFLASISVDTILSLILKIRGTFGGPILGVFTLGLFVPWSNTLGAVCGLVSGVGLTAWIAIGGLISGKDPIFKRKKPLSIEGCNSTYTELTSNYTANVETANKDYNPMYSVSYMYYSAIGLSTTVLIGMIVSLLTKSKNHKKQNKKLSRSLLCCNPKESKEMNQCIEENQKLNLEDSKKT